MRILIVTTSLPYPPASGGALRVYGIIRGLHDAGHQMSLIAFGDPEKPVDAPLSEVCEEIEIVPSPPPRARSERIRDIFLSNQPDIAKRLYSDTFVQKLLALIDANDYDLIQFEAIEAACYLPIVKQHGTSAKLCFDTFNAEAELQRTIFQIDLQTPSRWLAAAYSFVQSRRIARYEGDLCRTADLVIAVSEEDHAFLSAYRNDEKTYIVASGIFADHYAKTDETVSLPEDALVFTGKMDYRPNVDAVLWFSEQILPQLETAHLTIVGQKPHPSIQHLPQQPNITLTGWVDSVLPYLHAATIFVVPLRMGSGTRLKILEAMASGCAIVATSIAAAGLSDDVKQALVIADDEASFAQATTQLLKNPDERMSLGQLAQEKVKANYDWSVLIPRLLRAYEGVGLG